MAITGSRICLSELGEAEGDRHVNEGYPRVVGIQQKLPEVMLAVGERVSQGISPWLGIEATDRSLVRLLGKQAGFPHPALATVRFVALWEASPRKSLFFFSRKFLH